MIHVLFHKKFEKQFAKLPRSIQERYFEQLELFIQNPFHSSLNNHTLRGEYKDCNSINVTGDMRAIYTMEEDTIALFIRIGTHSELYS